MTTVVGWVAALALAQETPKPPSGATPAAAMDVFVDPSARGSDKNGDGSIEKPFQTIRKAIALHTLLTGRRTTIRLAVGHYGESSGESLPVVLPAGVSLVGAGSSNCEIESGEKLPVVVLPRTGDVALASLRLRDGAIGIVASDVADLHGVQARLVDVAIDNCMVGVDLAPANGSVELVADGLRVVHSRETALRTDGRDHLVLRLTRCEFVDCKEGVVLATDGAGPDGASQVAQLSDCRFEGVQAGLVRRGQDARNTAVGPIFVTGCRFERGGFGIDFECPNGDAPLVVRDSDFVQLENCGVSLVGKGVAPADEVQGYPIERCNFRWNGTGVQLVDVDHPVRLQDCRVEDSVGVGVQCASVAGGRAELFMTGCVVAANGGSGVVAQCEGRSAGRESGRVELSLENCTIADGRGAGVERRGDPKACGVSLVHCVVAANRTDLLRVDAKEVDGFLGGDPKFVAPALRDYRLAPDSPARKDGAPFGAKAAASPARDGK